MIAKSIIAGTVMSLMAGGVVYFGTEVEASNAFETRVETADSKSADSKSDVKAEISDDVMVGGEDNHPHESKIAVAETESSIDVPSVKTASGKTIEAKALEVSSAAADEKAAVETAMTQAEVTADEPKKRWLDKYLKSEKSGTETVEDTADDVTKDAELEAEGDTNTAQDLMDSMGLTKDAASDSDTASYIIKESEAPLTEEQIETAEAEGFEERVMETENIWTEDGSENKNIIIKEVVKSDGAIVITEGPDGATKTIDVKVIQNEDGQTTIETETIDMGDGKIMKIVKKTVKSDTDQSDDDNDMRIRVFTSKDGKGGLSAEDIRNMQNSEDVSIHKLMKQAKAKNISGTVSVVMAQAAKIEMPELRDRAYLDIVSYGLEHGDYDVAARAMKEIEQVELRDTARNRMAVAYAKDGNADEAFNILDDLEVDALRDVMRLQVIEAMIAPDQLPEDMQ